MKQMPPLHVNIYIYKPRPCTASCAALWVVCVGFAWTPVLAQMVCQKQRTSLQCILPPIRRCCYARWFHVAKTSKLILQYSRHSPNMPILILIMSTNHHRHANPRGWTFSIISCSAKNNTYTNWRSGKQRQQIEEGWKAATHQKNDSEGPQVNAGSVHARTENNFRRTIQKSANLCFFGGVCAGAFVCLVYNLVKYLRGVSSRILCWSL